MSDGVLLLADLRELFAKAPSGVLFTREILAGLNANETRPWPEYKHGKPLTDRQLATLLKAYKVRPRTVRRGTETEKGYKMEWFNAPFAAYPPPQPVTASQPGIPATFDAGRSVTPALGAAPNVTDPRGKKSSVSANCDAVTLSGALLDDG